VTDQRSIVRTVVEDCWTDPVAGMERMRPLLAPGYVHHMPHLDTDAEGFAAGLAWIDSRIGQRVYTVLHIALEGDLAAALLSFTGVRRDDGSAVAGRGAYHCRFESDLIAEDWDVFFPAG
jgi:SnoaL-like domain